MRKRRPLSPLRRADSQRCVLRSTPLNDLYLIVVQLIPHDDVVEEVSEPEEAVVQTKARKVCIILPS